MTKYKTVYEVRQKGNVVGRFLVKENAERFLEEFNTMTEVCSVNIVEQALLDYMIEEELSSGDNKWLDEHDTTSEMGGT